MSDSSISNAAAVVNYGLDAVARQYGVERVVQKIKELNLSSATPIHDLFISLGVDTPAEIDEIKLEEMASRSATSNFYSNGETAPVTMNRSHEGALQAIRDMKELISEVEVADPRYEGLRQRAKAAGKGYFEYAVGSQTGRGLTDLFNALAAEPKSEAPTATETSDNSTTPDNPNNLNTPDTPDRSTLNPEILA
ncbi:hypothetical protein IJG27_00720 [Candidatus Saccharibacteria bacterium]|nr:hypothetical protein [Candidatus Saccharibacteria bacterium]MBQ3440821.1 hypothetical protein [Candidatus Saccharibacteria bacterium]